MKTKKIRFLVYTSIFAALIYSSCSTVPVSITSSNTPLQNKKIIENLGPVEGKDTVYSVLSLWMIGRPDIEKAMSQALSKKGGDALINVKIYQTEESILLVSWTTVTVKGEAVKIEEIKTESPQETKESKEEKKDKKKSKKAE